MEDKLFNFQYDWHLSTSAQKLMKTRRKEAGYAHKSYYMTAEKEIFLNSSVSSFMSTQTLKSNYDDDFVQQTGYVFN